MSVDPLGPSAATDRLQIAVAIVTQGALLLVGRRPPHVPLAGCREFPGGKVKPGEAPATAAQRECREETGLAIEIDRLLETVVHDYAHGQLELHFFLAHPSDPLAEPQPPFTWLPRASLRAEDFPPANQSVLRQLGISTV